MSRSEIIAPHEALPVNAMHFRFPPALLRRVDLLLGLVQLLKRLTRSTGFTQRTEIAKKTVRRNV